MWRGGIGETRIGGEQSKGVKPGREGEKGGEAGGVGGTNEARGGPGVKSWLDVSERDPDCRRKETRNGTGGIRKKGKEWG